MAAPDLTIKHNPFAGEQASLELVNTKERKKQQKELLKLAAVLKDLESEVSQAKSDSVNNGAPEASKGNSGNKFENGLAEMTMALQMLQVEMAKYGYNKSSMDNKISKANLQLLTNNLNEIKKQIYKTEHESAWKRFFSGFLKVLGWVVAFAVAAFALVTGNIPLLVATIVIVILTQTPLLKDIINLSGEALTAMGVSKKVVDVIKTVESIAIILAIIIVSVISGNEAEAGEEVGELVNAVEEIGEEIGGVGEGAEGTEGSESKSSSLNPFKRFSLGTNLGVMNGFAALTGSNLVDNLMDTIADFDTNMSKDEKKRIEMILSLTVAVLSLVATLGAGTAAFGQLSEVAEAASSAAKGVEATEEATNEIAGFFEKIKSSLKSAMSGTKVFQAYDRAMLTTVIIEAIGSMIQGGLEIYQGVELMKLKKLEADTSLIQASMNMINATISEDAQMNKNLMKQQKVGNQSIMNLMKGENEIGTQLLNASQA